MTIAHITIVVWCGCEWIKIIPFFHISKNIFFGAPQNFSSLCVPWDEKSWKSLVDFIYFSSDLCCFLPSTNSELHFLLAPWIVKLSCLRFFWSLKYTFITMNFPLRTAFAAPHVLLCCISMFLCTKILFDFSFDSLLVQYHVV